jgi:Fe-S-cluster containining protein
LAYIFVGLAKPDGGTSMDIDDLYDLIPKLMCTEGCYECCKNFGVPSRTKVEDETIKTFLREHSMQPGEAKGHTCPYLDESLSEGGCSIYPVRPLICRLYGTSPNYLCKMGVEPLRFLHEDEEEEIFYLYRKNFF